MPAKIYILRHGNTFDTGDIVRRVGARTDLPLSQSGQRQAQGLALHFDGTDFRKAYCSPLLRTRQTAEAILKGQSIVPETLEFLREVDYGPDENKPESDVIARLGYETIKAWDAKAIVPDGWSVDPAAIKADWTQFLAAHKDIDGNVLVVTSNGVARFLFDVTKPKGQFDRKLKTGAYGVIEFEGEQPLITQWNVRPS